MTSRLIALLALATVGVGVANGCSSVASGGAGGAGGGSSSGGATGAGGVGTGGGHGVGGARTGVGGGNASGGSPGAGGHTGAGGSLVVMDAAAVDAGSMTCSPACGAGSVCVGTGTEGGPIIFEDAGVCPAGSHPSGIGSFCNRDLTYACMPIPAACGGGTPTCTCAAPTLCPPSHICRPQTDGALQCVEQLA